MTDCGGIPLGALSLLCGRSTSGKATVAYKILALAQLGQAVALLALPHTVDPEYLTRCGIDPKQLLTVQPAPGPEAVALLLDLVG